MLIKKIKKAVTKIFFDKDIVEAENYKKNIYNNPLQLQEQALEYLISTAVNTLFGKDHNFSMIKNINDYQSNVPVREYNDFEKYWDLVYKQQKNVTWPGKPEVLIISSASTGKPKLIPASKEYLTNFANSILRVIFQYIYDTGDYSLLDGMFMNFTGSNKLKKFAGFNVGPVSAVIKSLVQRYHDNSLPTQDVLELMNTKGWDVMFTQAAKQSIEYNITTCVGLPSWIMQYFNSCLKEFKAENLDNILPSLRLLITSGVSYKPYIEQFERLFNHKITVGEIYGASEGFFAYSDSDDSRDDLLLDVTKNFYEFMEINSINNQPDSSRICLADVKLNRHYIIIVSTCAGLWSYKMGDIIEFTSLNPFRIKVVGRTKHYISIQMEHVYSQHLESVIKDVNTDLALNIINFTVAPNDPSERQIPYHEWYIECKDSSSIDKDVLVKKIDNALSQYSSGYDNGRLRHSLAKPRVFFLQEGAFLQYLATKKTSSLQLKVPKVSNDRIIANFLIDHELVIKR